MIDDDDLDAAVAAGILDADARLKLVAFTRGRAADRPPCRRCAADRAARASTLSTRSITPAR